MRPLALGLVAVLPFVAQAQDREAVRAVLEPALVTAGLDTTLAFVEGTMVDPETPATRAFARDRMRPAVLGAFLDGTTLAQAQAFAAWTERPDVGPVLARERATGDPDYDARVDAFFDAGGDIDDDRVAAVLDLLDRTGYVDYAAEASLRQTILLAGLLEPDDLREPLRSVPLEDLLDGIRTSRGDLLRDGAEAYLTDLYYVAFADLSLDELDAYLDAVERPEAQWYFGRLATAFLSAYDEALRSFIAER